MLLPGVVITVLVLISMLGAKEPQRSAMAIVLYAAIASVVFNAAYVSGWISVYELSPLIGNFEIIAALATIALSLGLRKKDRTFFYNMAKFLLLSASVNFVAPLEVITETTYQIAAYMVVLAHLVYMLRNSDGVMDIFRGVWNHIGSNDLANIDSGQRESR